MANIPALWLTLAPPTGRLGSHVLLVLCIHTYTYVQYPPHALSWFTRKWQAPFAHISIFLFDSMVCSLLCVHFLAH